MSYSLIMSKKVILSPLTLLLLGLFVSACRVSGFSVNPSSFASTYPMSDDIPDECLKAESERLQTQLMNGKKTFDHRNVDRSALELKIVQLAADYVQDTAALSDMAKNDSETDHTIRDCRAPLAGSSPPTLINERLPAFLKPIPSNSTKPSNSMDSAPAASNTKQTERQGRGKPVPRLFSFAGSVCSRMLSPFRKSRRESPSPQPTSSTAVVVEMDDCSSWA
jgi:hypothetical protein